jgi:antitoxin MazE
MAHRGTVGRWGGNLAIRLPRDIAAEAGLSDGDRVEIEAKPGEVTIRAPRPRFLLDELIAGMTPEAMRSAFDWGGDQGRESLE